MSTRRSVRLGTTCLFVSLFLSSSAAHAFECPEPQPQTEPGILEETKQEIATWSTALAGNDLLNRIDELVSRLREEHSGLGNAELVNYLVTAYCPVVTQLSGLTDGEKAARLERFSEQVFSVVSR